MNLKFHFLFALTFATSCGLPVPWASDAFQDESASQNISVIDKKTQGDSAEGTFQATATTTQQLGGSGTLSSATLSIPPGTLLVNTAIQITPAPPMETATELAELGLSNDEVKAAGPPVMFIPADPSVAPLKPMTLQIPTAVAIQLGLLADGFQAVLFKAIVPGETELKFGVIPAPEVRIMNGMVQFETMNFGAFQSIRTVSQLSERMETAATEPLPATDFLTNEGQAQQQEHEAEQSQGESNQNSGETNPGSGEETAVSISLTHSERHGSAADTPEISIAVQGDPATIELSYSNSETVPTDGWVSVTESTHQFVETALSDGHTYYVHARALDAQGNVLHSATSQGWQQLGCPENYIKVPGNETEGLGGSYYTLGSKTAYDRTAAAGTQTWTRGISDFCVMKYESRSGGTSGPVTSTPQVSVTQDTAAENCESNGANYALITNNQWQTIARNIESQPDNKNSSGVINMGVVGTNAGGYALRAASTNDSQACIGISAPVDADYATIPTSDCGGQWHHFKRTHILSNGEIIWDFAGNVSEFVNDRPTKGLSSYDFDNLTASEMLRLGPSGSYNHDPSTKPYGGLGKLLENVSLAENTPSSMDRGGSSYQGGGDEHAGIFTYRLHGSTGKTGEKVGYRCVYAP